MFALFSKVVSSHSLYPSHSRSGFNIDVRSIVDGSSRQSAAYRVLAALIDSIIQCIFFIWRN